MGKRGPTGLRSDFYTAYFAIDREASSFGRSLPVFQEEGEVGKMPVYAEGDVAAAVAYRLSIEQTQPVVRHLRGKCRWV